VEGVADRRGEDREHAYHRPKMHVVAIGSPLRMPTSDRLMEELQNRLEALLARREERHARRKGRLELSEGHVRFTEAVNEVLVQLPEHRTSHHDQVRQ
jgi:hypothetical protein